ncbi:DUF6064 family protein [Halomonas daqiaonensis]|uniref:MFS transporter permease n=1 Tax=Halomonas daqiaonensis TaxID=650850 RepID=A0A1H7MQ68_9GAMM|nr:DUF6064 family protein [Halomonas daqiaonensis]SEL13382.1 hypothetical protein SAMN04488129_10740 [Halomonas daqiaonensis]
MGSAWWTYRPEDLLMFSPRVYERLFELHNQALWPAQLLALVLGGMALAVLLRPGPRGTRLVLMLLAVAWGFVAWAFLWQRYAPIHWGIAYIAPLFGFQALLLVALGSLRGGLRLPCHWSVRRGIGIGLFAYALALHPLIAVATGRGLSGAEVIGLTPDPLAMATLAVGAMAEPARRAWPLVIIPVFWCLQSWLTLDTLGERSAWLPLLAVAVALTARLWPSRQALR